MDPELWTQIFGAQTPAYEMMIRLAIATAFGMAIGMDREARRKPAGLRTHMLISLAAAVFTLLTFEISHTATTTFGDSVRPDPVRITEAVITGVAFLGAGAIIRARGKVQGITTGTSMWLAGAIGMACGGGYYTIAALTLVFSICVLTLVGYLEYRLAPDEDPESD